MISLFSWSSNWAYLILPSISIFGFITNILNICVLLSKKMKDISFKYLLATSISDLFYLSISSYIFIYECTACPFHNSYFTQFFDIYIAHYISACLAIFNILTDITLSIIRYSILKNKNYIIQTKYYSLVIGSLFIISFLFYLPPLFFKVITPIYKNQTNLISSDYTQFTEVKTSIGSTQFGTITPIILSVFRIFLAIFILTSINILNVIEFRKRFSHRIHQDENHERLNNIMISTILQQQQSISNATNQTQLKACRNITLMVIFQCILYTFGNIY
jgi:hypothetical protein